MTVRIPTLPLREKWPHYMRLMRLDRPIGSFLLLWPTLWALWFAAGGFPSIGNLIVFVLGVFMMRAAGCAINDFADRDWDGAVERTHQRPLATGAIQPREAIVLFLLLSLAAFSMVVLFTNRLTLYLSFGGLALAFIYPFMKRYTHLPQLFLGAAFSWAIPMAWAAQADQLSRLTWLVFTANVLWTVAYDTFYAMVDRDDDLKVGIKSTAILFGEADRLIIGIMQALTVVVLFMVGHQCGRGVWFNLGLVAMASLFVYQQHLVRHRDRQACFRAFLNNNWAGFAVFVGLVLDYALH
ncbi:4-hydroxybenzoate octaprenyltransferase [Mangrovitalea sediminis]|uniref:4-hydroxybenzoate octaprenyltransferase n=1 Tax=Mangrovitalea sediminis TaxID=1982043 RepID=UPI000BE58BE3|nr:4-hydroxybenzoate octaprenyltransferase [Mangrovitalea sediminis]